MATALVPLTIILQSVNEKCRIVVMCDHNGVCSHWKKNASATIAVALGQFNFYFFMEFLLYEMMHLLNINCHLVEIDLFCCANCSLNYQRNPHYLSL